MESQVLSLSNLENELVRTARATHGDVLDNAEQIISFFNDAIILTDRPKGWIFMLYLSQLRANLSLMLLSTIRKHDIQMLMMARQMLEATSLACYALSQQEFDMNNCSSKSLEVVIQEMGTWKNKKYKWLDLEFPIRSSNVKKLKDKMNLHYEHAGTFTAQNNLVVDDTGKMLMAFFDEREIEFVPRRLRLCSSLALEAIGLIADVVEKYPSAVRLAPDFNKNYNLFSNSTDQLLPS
jgi:hypothetical protein